MTGGWKLGSTSGGGRKAVRCGWMARWMPTPVKAASTVTSPPMRASFQDGRMEDSSRGSSGDNAAILTQFSVFVQTKFEGSAAAEDLLQGLPEPAELEAVACRLRLVRDGSPTIEQQLRLRAERQAKQQSRCGKPGRAMQDPADLFGYLNLPTDIRGHGIDGAAQPLILEPEPIEPDDVVDVDPGEPLAAAAQRTADE